MRKSRNGDGIRINLLIRRTLGTAGSVSKIRHLPSFCYSKGGITGGNKGRFVEQDTSAGSVVIIFGFLSAQRLVEVIEGTVVHIRSLYRYVIHPLSIGEGQLFNWVGMHIDVH